MKTILSLFDSLRKPSDNSANGYTPNGQTIDVMEDVFVDNIPPEVEVREPAKPLSPMKKFLDTNYQFKGFNDGYNYHSTDVMNNNLKVIRTEFRQLVDILIDEKQQEIYLTKDSLIESEGISERFQRRLENRIQELEATVRQLTNEKDLSAFGEGFVSAPLSCYQDGFARGLEKYQQEKLLAYSTGLFD